MRLHIALTTTRHETADEDESSFAWLITFADLMTILLVFAFVMIVSTDGRHATPATPGTPAATIPSFIDTAYASRADTAPQVPGYLPRTTTAPGRHRGDRVVKRIVLPLRAAGLTARDEVHLAPVAALMQHNPALRLILHPPAGVGPAQWGAPLTDLRAHLGMTCKIDPARIYIQPAAACRTATSHPAPMIELTLEQPFWEL